LGIAFSSIRECLSQISSVLFGLKKVRYFGRNLNNALATLKDLNNSAVKATMSEGLVKASFCLQLVIELEVITADFL